MKKDIKKLLAKQTPLTGEDAGRLMILDLLSVYKDLLDGGRGTGVLSAAEKIEIVDSLTSPEDISHFNDFRGVHDYLTTVSAVCDSFIKTYETHYWRLYFLLSNMVNAEAENTFMTMTPIIMTEEQYKKFTESGEPHYPPGIAVLQKDPSAPGPYEESGFDYSFAPQWRRHYSAENILLEYSGHISQSICGVKDALAEHLARIKALELIGRYIKVPKVSLLIPPVDENKFNMTNEYLTSGIKEVFRAASHGEQYEQELRQKLSELLTPIDLSELEPDPSAVKKARRALNFSLIKNGSESFVSMIKKEWRNDNAQ